MALHNFNNKLYEPRKGLMLHYDDSAEDSGAVEWLMRDPKCHVSYNRLYLRDGRVQQVAPDNCRAWHAGVCKPSDSRLPYKDANSCFHGWAAAGNDSRPITPLQFESLVRDAALLFKQMNWRDLWRVTTHHLEAWPRGRKVDIEGPNPAKPFLDLTRFRQELAKRL